MKPSKILIVDDDSKLSSLIALILRRAGGYEVREENRSFAALATAREYLPDLVLLDVDMPGKDGGAVAHELAGDSLLSAVPIIFITSLIAAGEAGTRNGAVYLAKPVEPKRLIETVQRLCPKFRREMQAA
ncbi:MAG TPA: response regulator [Chthoniobacter sp.]